MMTHMTDPLPRHNEDTSATLLPRYREALHGWPAAMQRHLYRIPGQPALGCYGPGNSGHWAVQANATAAAALAICATDSAAPPGWSQDELLEWALRLVRFTFHSHRAGGGVATDKQPWGYSWISALGLERMMHGIEALDPYWTDEDRARMAAVLQSECDWLLDHYQRDPAAPPGTITAGLYAKHNHPENNIWNGCLLHRLIRLYPDAPRRDEYEEKGTAFLCNGISIEADATDDILIGGRPLADWHVGANFFPSYALNHHGYLNVGYMVICLSNIAMMHFSCRAQGWEPPEGLYLHARELWQLVKSCTLPDGRLWRIGGDTRVRYAYCQDYAVPAWLLARDCFGDADVPALEAGWLSIIAQERAANGDGTFMSQRLASLAAMSPLYYARLEGDRAAALSMALAWHRHEAAPPTDPSPSHTNPITVLPAWSDDYHGSQFTRGPGRWASWTWRGAHAFPLGLCLPPTDSSLAEWHQNLTGSIRGLGMYHQAETTVGSCEAFDGGFATCGQLAITTCQPVAEGERDCLIARIDLACVALPDDRTVIVLQRARTEGRVWLQCCKGLFLQIPNDLFNGFTRCCTDSAGTYNLPGCPQTAETRAIAGDWVNVDERLSVARIYGPPLVWHQPAGRQVTIPRKEPGGGHLHAVEICCGVREELHAVDADTDLFDLGVVLLSSVDAEQTRHGQARHPPRAGLMKAPGLRGVEVVGADNRTYRVAANFSAAEHAVAWDNNPASTWQALTRHDIAPGDGGDLRVLLPPHQVVVWVGA